ncbi:MAG: hypothetical protein E7221_07235 [Clostridiales bacterium]|nr:hypothetical protein [Clostridiales bacterium]MBQ3321932.1 hypothetical protein [Bacillota bacterium]
MKKKRNVPLIIIGLTIPLSWGLFAVLQATAALDALDHYPEWVGYSVVIAIWGLPIFAFIVYGIYCIVTAKPSIPKVKEKMPWDKGDPLDVDEEWRSKMNPKQK